MFWYFYHKAHRTVIVLFRPGPRWALLLYPTIQIIVNCQAYKSIAHLLNAMLHNLFSMRKFSANQRAQTLLTTNEKPLHVSRLMFFSSSHVSEDPEDQLRPGGGPAQDCGVPGEGSPAKPSRLLVEKWRQADQLRPERDLS